eukprot:COSAG02_NODE_2391_length_8978_cov_14.980403_8_plen_102_part_00
MSGCSSIQLLLLYLTSLAFGCRVYEDQFPLNASVPMEMSRQQYEKVGPSYLFARTRHESKCCGSQFVLHVGTVLLPSTVQLAVAINMGTNLPSCATPNGEC